MNRTIFQNVGILYRNYLNYANSFLKDFNLSFSESVVISNIGVSEGITQEGIASLLCIDKAAVARNVKLLKTGGLIEVKKSADDKRLNKLYLTPEGREKYKAISAANAELLTDLYEELTPSEISTLETAMNKLAEKSQS